MSLLERAAGINAVFVYGTLKRAVNSDNMAGAEFVGLARTAPLFTLYDLGDYPALVYGGTQSVSGELYYVDNILLRALDRREDHPVHYVRQEIPLSDGARAWAYALPRRLLRGDELVVTSGSWSPTA